MNISIADFPYPGDCGVPGEISGQCHTFYPTIPTSKLINLQVTYLNFPVVQTNLEV